MKIKDKTCIVFDIEVLKMCIRDRIKMEQAFTYNLAWGMTKASIQAREEKLELGRVYKPRSHQPHRPLP